MISGPQSPTIVLVGDSHAWHLYSGLASQLAKSHSDETIALFAYGVSPPLFNVVRLDYADNDTRMAVINNALTFAEKTDSVRTVIMSAYWTGPIGRSGALARPGQTSSSAENSVRVFESALRETLTRLTVSGKHVILVLDNPDLHFDPKSCIDRPLRITAVRSPCAIPYASFADESRVRLYRDIVARVLKDFPKVTVFDAAVPLCDKQWCWAMKDSKPLYIDSNHLSVIGSEYIAQQLAPLIMKNSSVR
jgi:hypothetical protein